MKHLTRTTLAVAAAFCAVSQPAQAHFQLLYTPKVMLEKHGKIPLKLVFSHPMEMAEQSRRQVILQEELPARISSRTDRAPCLRASIMRSWPVLSRANRT